MWTDSAMDRSYGSGNYIGGNEPAFPGAGSRLTQSFNGGVGVNGSFIGGGGSGSSGPSSISSSSYTPALDYSYR